MTDARWSLIVAHRERLVALARRRCPTLEDAEDVVQEALLRAATHADLDETRVAQFLTTVTVHLCADLYRAADRTNRAVRRLAPQLQDVPSPEERACSDASAATLAGMLGELPERQREVLVDRAHGLSVTQIGVRHALSYKAAESALARARGAMRLAIASSLAALVAAFRPRRIALVAVPVSALLLFTTAVLHHPIAPHRPGTHAGSMPGGSLAGDPPDARSTQVRDGHLTGVRMRLRSAMLARVPDRTPTRQEFAKLDLGPTSTKASGDPMPPPDVFAKECLHEGVWFEFKHVSPDDVNGSNGCGRGPHDSPGSTVVHFSAAPLLPPERT